VATTALGLALILRINEAFGSVEEDEIIAAKASQSLARPKRPAGEAAE
jgi:multicomponent Na+:H+ antiporter subunit C